MILQTHAIIDQKEKEKSSTRKPWLKQGPSSTIPHS